MVFKHFKPYYERYFIRITGGEIGRVPNLIKFIKYVNKTPEIEYVLAFSKGDIFFNLKPNLLKKKFHISEHLIHDVAGGKFIRYDKISPPLNIKELQDKINMRKNLCKNYDCVMVATKNITSDIQKQLESCGIYFFEQMARIGIYTPIVSPNANKYKECYFSKRNYVYDVSQKVFMHCCEEKNPELGENYDSIIDFFLNKIAIHMNFVKHVKEQCLISKN